MHAQLAYIVAVRIVGRLTTRALIEWVHAFLPITQLDPAVTQAYGRRAPRSTRLKYAENRPTTLKTTMTVWIEFGLHTVH